MGLPKDASFEVKLDNNPRTRSRNSNLEGAPSDWFLSVERFAPPQAVKGLGAQRYARVRECDDSE
jgi:hypothetical protein